MIPKLFIILIFFSFCSTTNSFSYEIAIEEEANLDTKLIFNIRNNIDNSYSLEVQAFPKNPKKINNYRLVFDMTFREDYESDFNDVCIGPDWESNGPGEVEIVLNKSENFRKSLNGIITDSQDRCQNYFYYVRYFDVELINNKKLVIGSATDYSDNYPDAPKYWLLNQNKEIEKIGNTNIKKYSLNFELRK